MLSEKAGFHFTTTFDVVLSICSQVELAEIETGLLLKKAQEAEAMIAKIREEKAQTEAAKKALEEKAREAEVLAARMQADAAKRKAEGMCVSFVLCTKMIYVLLCQRRPLWWSWRRRGWPSRLQRRNSSASRKR